MKKVLFMLIAAIIAISASAQTKRALVIGISEYQYCGDNSWGAIHGANDADSIVPVLQAQGFKVTKLCNKAATAKRIRKGLNDLITSCKQGDMVYIHFSCHGQPFEDRDGDEKEYGWDESIVPYDAQISFKKGKYEGQNHIIDDELHKYFQKVRKKIGKNGFVCVVVDACHSGGSSRSIDEAEDDEEDFVRGTDVGFSPNGKKYCPPLNDIKGYFRIPRGSGLADITILEACRRDQKNHEIKQSNKYYGPLSYSVSQVLKTKKLSKSLGWVEDVKKQMDNRCKDRLTGRPKQNMVCETSLK